jgi:L-asparagine transporter-like permease
MDRGFNGLTRRQIEYFALGGTLGAGIFLGVGQGIHAAGPVMIAAYVLAGIAVYYVMRCLGEIALNDPDGGTFVSYARRYLGFGAAFVQGWSYWSCAVLVAMAELTAVGLFLHLWMPGLPQWIPALIALVALGGINSLSVRVFGNIELGLAIIKIGVLVGFLLLGLAILLVPSALPMDGADIANLWRNGGFAPQGLHGFLAILPVALFAFGGAELVCLAAAETADPKRALPRAINGLLLRLSLFYAGTTLMIICLIPWSAVPPDASPIVLVFQRVGVPAAAALMNGVLIIAMLSSCNSMLFGAARVMRSLAQEQCAPAALAALNRRGVPGLAVGFSMIAVSLAITLNYFIPRQVFGLLMNSTALIVVVVWCTFMLIHLRFRRVIPLTSGTAYPAPFAPWSNYVVLGFLAATVLILAFDADFRASFLCVAALFAVLVVFAMVSRQGLRARIQPLFDEI